MRRFLPVPPYPSLSRGEEAYDLIASWILENSVTWAKAMRDDLYDLLKNSLRNIESSMDDSGFWELGGLLALGTRVRDKGCGKIAASFMLGDRGKLLPGTFISIFDRDGLYGKRYQTVLQMLT